MAENIEKTEADLLEEAMKDLNLDELPKETNQKTETELLEEAMNGLALDSNNDKKEEIEIEEELINLETNDDNETKNIESNPDEISAIDEVDLNNLQEDKEKISPAEDIKLEQDEEGVQKKQSKLQKILIIVLGVLFAIILGGAGLFFTGFFDPEPIVEVTPTEQQAVVEIKKDEYKFKPEDIDENRLNKKLNLLTKYEIVENKSTEEEKAQEREKLYQEARKELEEERRALIERIKEAERKRLEETLPIPTNVTTDEKIDKEIDKVIDSNNQEETVSNETKTENYDSITTTENDTTNDDMTSQNNIAQNATETEVDEEKELTENTQNSNVVENSTTNDDNNTNTNESTIISENTNKVQNDEPALKSFVKVIKISTNQKDIYKSFLDKVLKVTSEIKLCRDDKNLVEVFVGPFNSEDERVSLSNEFKSANIEAEVYDFTQEEFDRRCNY